MSTTDNRHKRISLMLVFVGAAAVTCLLFINFCNLLYQCGCVSLWAGAADHCNLHAVHLPHCPWCVNATAGYSSFAVIIVVQALAVFIPGTWGARRRLVLALVAFPVAGAVMGVAWGLYTRYWAG